MPNYADPNVVDSTNSTSTPLLASGVFVGTFREVTGYASVSVLVHSDRASATNGLQFQWSTDGINVDDEQTFNYAGTASGLGLVVHASVRAAFYRTRYVNTSLNQSFMRLQTLLRRESSQGSIGYLGQPVTTNDDTLVTKAVLAARDISTPSNVLLPFCTGDPFLIVEHPPNRNTISERTVAQAIVSQQLDFFGVFGGTRRTLSVLNDTDVGNLLIRYNTAASLTSFSIKVPPQHLWEMPTYWGNFSGGIHGIWDAPGLGSARVLEMF